MPELRKRKTKEKVSYDVEKRERREIPSVSKKSKTKSTDTPASQKSKSQKPSTTSHSKRKKDVSYLSSDEESPKCSSEKKRVVENLSSLWKDPKLTKAKVVLHSLRIKDEFTDSKKSTSHAKREKNVSYMSSDEEPPNGCSKKESVVENLSSPWKDPKLTKAKVVLHFLKIRDESADSEKSEVLHSLNMKDEFTDSENFLFHNSEDSGIFSETSINMCKDDSKPNIVLKSEPSIDLSNSDQQCKDKSSSIESQAVSPKLTKVVLHSLRIRGESTDSEKSTSHSKREKNVSYMSSDEELPKCSSKKKSVIENLSSPWKDPKLTKTKVVSRFLKTRDESADSEKTEVLHSLNMKDELTDSENFLFHNSEDSGVSSEKCINMYKEDSKPDIVLKSEPSIGLSNSDQQCKDESASSESEWEEVEDNCEASLDDYKPDIPKEGVEITIDCPDLHIRKRKKKQVDENEWIRLHINRVRKDIQLSIHKTHLLCLLAHGIYVNKVLNCDSVKAFALSLIPNDILSLTSGKKVDKIDISGIEKVVSWFCDTFAFKNEKCLFLNIFSSMVRSFVNKTSMNASEYNLMFIAIARILGFKVRFCESLYPVTYKASNLIKKPNSKRSKKSEPVEATEKKGENETETTQKQKVKFKKAKPPKILKEKEHTNPDEQKKKNDKDEPKKKKDKDEPKKKKGKDEPKKKKEKDEPKKKKDKDEPKKKNGKKILRPRRSKGKNYKVSIDEDDNSDDEDFKMNDIQSDEDDSSDDENFIVNDFQSIESPRKKNSKSRGRLCNKSSNLKAISSDSEPSSPKQSVFESGNIICWAEIYSKPDKQWICIECSNYIINKPYKIEALAPQPVSYVLAFDNESYIKDLTRRYCSDYMTDTIKVRVEPEWWEDTLEPFLPPNSAQNKAEEKQLDEMLVNKPLPTNIQGFKNHPLYALKRHVLKYEAIYPPDAPPVGFIRGEPVYARDCVHRLKSRENWFKEARVVRVGEEPYKIVTQPRWDKIACVIRTDVPLEAFGLWQTEPYEPPVAVNGKVPRNEFGNVDLFKPCMLPRGTVHLQLPGLNRIAKKLGIDCSPAIVGFEVSKKRIHPVCEGFVVCEEFKDTIVEAWDEEQENAKKREEEKREKRIYGNWKKLIRGLLIRERIKLKYDVH